MDRRTLGSTDRRTDTRDRHRGARTDGHWGQTPGRVDQLPPRRQTEGWGTPTDTRTDRRRQTDGQTEQQTHGQTDKRTDGHTDRAPPPPMGSFAPCAPQGHAGEAPPHPRADGRTRGWMDGHAGGQTDRQTCGGGTDGRTDSHAAPTYEAVCLPGAGAAPRALLVAALVGRPPEAAPVALGGADGLGHCGEGGGERDPGRDPSQAPPASPVPTFLAVLGAGSPAVPAAALVAWGACGKRGGISLGCGTPPQPSMPPPHAHALPLSPTTGSSRVSRMMSFHSTVSTWQSCSFFSM